MEGVPLRNARRGDIPSLLLLWTAMMKENARLDPRLAPHPRARAHMAERFAAWLQDENRSLVVAEEKGRVLVGYAAAGVVPGNGWQAPSTIGEISDCYVAAPRRRLGIGRRLVGRVMDLLYERGIASLRLQAAAKNEGAAAFWRSLGFEAVEEIWERAVEREEERDE